MQKVIMPELGEEIDSATLTYWYAAEGARVKAEDDLVELMTDKATFSVPAGADGFVRKLYFQVGDCVSIGDTLAEIENPSGAEAKSGVGFDEDRHL